MGKRGGRGKKRKFPLLKFLEQIVVTIKQCYVLRYHRGSDAVTVQFLHRTDEVESPFCFFYVVPCSLFFLTHATDNVSILLTIETLSVACVRKNKEQEQELTIIFKLKQAGSYIIKPHRD